MKRPPLSAIFVLGAGVTVASAGDKVGPVTGASVLTATAAGEGVVALDVPDKVESVAGASVLTAAGEGVGVLDVPLVAALPIGVRQQHNVRFVTTTLQYARKEANIAHSRRKMPPTISTHPEKHVAINSANDVCRASTQKM